MVDILKIEKEQKNFDWVESVERVLGVLINVSMIPETHLFLFNSGTVELIEDLCQMTVYSEEHKTVITRLMYLLSRLMVRIPVIEKVASSKIMVVRIFLYFNRNFPELSTHVIKILFGLFQLKEKLGDYVKEYEISINNFVKEAKGMLAN